MLVCGVVWCSGSAWGGTEASGDLIVHMYANKAMLPVNYLLKGAKPHCVSY